MVICCVVALVDWGIEESADGEGLGGMKARKFIYITQGQHTCIFIVCFCNAQYARL